jgi:hypothetical protein
LVKVRFVTKPEYCRVRELIIEGKIDGQIMTTEGREKTYGVIGLI